MAAQAAAVVLEVHCGCCTATRILPRVSYWEDWLSSPQHRSLRHPVASMATLTPPANVQWMLSSKPMIMNHMSSHKKSWAPAPALPEVGAPIRVFIRARPLLKRDEDASSYSVLDVQQPRTVHLTSGVVRALAGRIATKSYDADGAFGEFASNDDVHAGIGVDEAINNALETRGYDWTVLMYGQTGTGKTYTATGIEERLMEVLFKHLPAVDPPVLSLSIFELRGSSVYDLLSDPPLQVVKVLGTDGENSMRGLSRHEVLTENGIRSLLARAKELRSTRSTVKNDASSRSHCVVSVHVLHPGSGDESKRLSTLHIIDLAGSERSIYSQHNDASTQKESIETNKSLAVLKECVRARLDPASKHTPWRNSRLTMVLRRAFERKPNTRVDVVVLACVSPSVLDVEDTASTLKWVMPFQLGAAEQAEGAVMGRLTPVWNDPYTEWSYEQSMDYLKRYMPKLVPVASRLIPSDATIACLLDLSIAELSALCSKPAAGEKVSPTDHQIKDAKVWVGTYHQKFRDLKAGKGKVVVQVEAISVKKVGGTGVSTGETRNKALKALDRREIDIGETGAVTRVTRTGTIDTIVGRLEKANHAAQ